MSFPHNTLILNTRAEHQADELTRELKKHGADVLEIPAIEIEFLEVSPEMRSALRLLAEKDVVAFTSSNAVRALGRSLNLSEALKNCSVAAVGEKTMSCLAENGVKVAMISSEGSATSLGETVRSTLSQIKGHSPTIVFFKGDTASSDFASALGKYKDDLTECLVYRSRISKSLRARLNENAERLKEISALTFLSESAVRHFVDALERSVYSQLAERPVVVVGPKTASAAGISGFKQVYIAREPSVLSLTETLLQALS